MHMSIFYRPSGWQDFWKTSPVTSVIIIINTVMFVATLVLGSFTVGNWLLFNGAIVPEFVLQFNEWWRILSAAFLHFGFLHFFGNVIIGLVALSSALERLIGSKRFAFIYFGSLILSGIAVVFFSADFAFTAGASGAIFGVLGAFLYIILYRGQELNRRDVDSLRSLIIINIVFTFLPALSNLFTGSTGGISVSGHIGGIIAGFLLSYVVISRTPEPEVIIPEEQNPWDTDDWYS
jgi:rhomboid protease GluP